MDVEDDDKMEDITKGGDEEKKKTSACQNGFITMEIIYCQ